MSRTVSRHALSGAAAAALSLVLALVLAPVHSSAQEPEPSTTATAQDNPDGQGQSEPSGEPTGSPTSGPLPSPVEPTSSRAPEPTGAPAGANDDPLAALELSASLDKTRYDSGDLITITLTVTNSGAEEIGPLTDHRSYNLEIVDWGELRALSEGIRLGPGETFRASFSGYLREIMGGTFGYDIGVVGPPSADGHSVVRSVHLNAPVAMTTGTYAGRIYADRDSDGAYGPGEELPGVRITLTGGVPESAYHLTTGADGRFSVSGIPTGRYRTSFGTSQGWYVTSAVRHVRVGSGVGEPVLLRAVRPLAERLDVSLRFSQARYELGEPARLRVTLANTGRSTLRGLTVWCARKGDSNELTGTGPGWGVLGAGTGGLTLGPGEHRTVEVSEPMPAGGPDYGYVIAGCDVISTEMGIVEGPGDFDTVNVAGIEGAIEGRFMRPGADPARVTQHIAGVRYELVNPSDGTVAARGTSGADGGFDVSGVLARGYILKLLDGWRFEFNDAGTSAVSAQRESPGRAYYTLVGGPPAAAGGEPREDSDASGGGTPQGVDGDLASTGFMAGELTWVALAAIGAGAGALLFARRRRPRA